MKTLVIDNYDSFTYNLVHILRELGIDESLRIVRNDAITMEEVGKYEKILLSPGPGLPKDAGIMSEVISNYGADKCIMGVCLGHQGIAENYGASLYNMSEVLHGIATEVTHDSSDDLFKGIPTTFNACRYHSWSVDPTSITDQLKVIARDEKGEVMAISHKEYCVKGVQFHPESILTEHGKSMLDNWIKL